MKTVSLYVADSEFKTYLCELIDQQYHEAGPSHFITFTPRMQAIWNDYPWDSRTILPWVAGKGLTRQFGLPARLRQIQTHFAQQVEDADRVILHTYQIFSERINCVISHLLRRYPNVEFQVRLIPDGTLNLRRNPMTGWRRFPQWFNRLKWASHADISTYAYSGDRLGADAPICDRIYLPRNFPSEYDAQKIYPIQMPVAEDQRNATQPRTALVLGSWMVKGNLAPASSVRAIANRIAKLLEELNVERVIYKPHPVERLDDLELSSPGQEILETSLCLERLIVQQKFDVLVSCCSTALVTAKLIQPELDVFSVGLNLLEEMPRNKKHFRNFGKVYQKLGISLVTTDLEPAKKSHRQLPIPKTVDAGQRDAA